MNLSWRTSFHGGHSWPFCDHATGSLESILEAACEQGMSVFGVTEHAPRVHERFLYPPEREWGWTVAMLEQKFEDYFARLDELIPRFEGDLHILRGFEAEVVPASAYAELTMEYARRHAVDYFVGSVHYVGEISIDSFLEDFHRALERFDGVEKLACAYYEEVASMVATLRPAVVGHLDLIRKFGHRHGALDTPSIRSAAREALEEVARVDAALDVNTAGYRKGLGSPYPAPWLVEAAAEQGIAFSFGDDSHKAEDVGAGLDEARAYLLECGVSHVRVLYRGDDGALKHNAVPL